MARRVINGEPGDTWTNNTGVVYWQLFTSLINVCGACWAKHGEVAEWHGLPFHRKCRCRVSPIAPGAKSQPFVDFRKMLDEMDESQHQKAVGMGNWRLIQSGTVKWEDVVTSHRVRPLHEVIAREKLSFDNLVKAGIDRRTAQAEWDKVHTPAHEAFAAKINRAASALKTAGLTDDQIKHGFAERISPRITGIEKVPTIAGKIPAGQKVDWDGSRISGNAAKEIIAGNVILERIRRGQSEEPVRMPDFQGSVSAMWQWVAETFPTTHESLSKEDWDVLVLAVAEQAKLKKIFQGLGLDADKAIKAIK